MAESSGQVMEGFLCPTCYMNLKTPHQLITHFQEKHEDEQDVLKSLKDLLGKAKKKIGFSQDNESENTFDYSNQQSYKEAVIYGINRN
jgi:rabenosyn-5